MSNYCLYSTFTLQKKINNFRTICLISDFFALVKKIVFKNYFSYIFGLSLLNTDFQRIAMENVSNGETGIQMQFRTL